MRSGACGASASNIGWSEEIHLNEQTIIRDDVEPRMSSRPAQARVADDRNRERLHVGRVP
ncbi:hypothetical protein WI41_16530 [Burkholderia latens]|uniref:Uncharacterized protein n=1 Tax=Burkholderia latens TaxID=488446 RepID=A0AAP1G7Q5_9BURK|nr:hypothetical protein WK25_16965 [Burkholderia latens]KVA06774.1 hypothetical protein WI41_16530 [Burkholderia latens]